MAQTPKFCNRCGARLDKDANACSKCGHVVKPPKTPAEQTATPAKAPAASEPLPEGFLPLLALIVKRTIASFFRQLPLTILFGVGAWLFHTYLLVVVNEGFSPSGGLSSRFLALQGQFFSGTIIWMVGSALVMGLLKKLFGKKGRKVTLDERINAIKRYFTEARNDAYSIIAAGVGVSLILGALMNGSANLMLALGMGALLASRAGSVISLLFRSAWNSLYSVARREQIHRYAMASGYTSLFATSLGFIVNSAITPNGMTLGIIALGVALALTLSGGRGTGATTALVFIATSLALLAFGDLGMVFADDGGWQEGGRTLQSWLSSGGAALAVLYGAGPAVAAGFGAALSNALTALGDSLPLDGEEFTGKQPDDIQGETKPPEEPPGTTSDTDKKPPDEPQTVPAYKSSGLIDPETGDPLVEHDGVSYDSGKEGQVWYNNRWMDRKAVEAQIDRHQKENPLFDPRTGEYLTVNDGKSGYDAKEGQVWFEGRWMDRSDAISALNQVRGDVDRQNEQIREDQHQWALQEDAKRVEKLKQEGFVFDKKSDSWVPGPNYQKSESQLERVRIEHLVEKAEKLGKREGGELQKEMEGLIKDGNFVALNRVYRDYWEHQVSENTSESMRQLHIADREGLKETAAKVILTASRGALMVLGGPSGFGATAALSVGAISAAGEAAETQAEGGSAWDIAKSTAAGFLSGVKDVAIGRYVNLPGTSDLTKIALPAAGDVAETFIRTGDVKRSLKTGAISVVGDVVGIGSDRLLKSGIKKESIAAGTSALTGGTLNVVNGGSFGDGVTDGLINHVGGRIGGSIGNHGANTSDPERAVEQAIAEASEKSKEVIPTHEQPEIIQNLENSRYEKVIVDENGKVRTNENGEPVTEQRVNTKQALEQLQDTKSSRTAKQAEPELKDAIIKTRAEEIYAPADKATIEKAQSKPEVQEMMKPGDKLVMDTFSTPGKPPSLGADRDARLVIKRPDGVDEHGKPKFENIEVDRRHWENDAYQDFYDHSMKIMGGRENITSDSHPEFFRRREELSYLRKAGMSQEQIDARAWAEAHNQLFTDKSHMEASRDNSDQAIRITPKGIEHTQKTPNILNVQKGKSDRLKDPAGFAKMWQEKSRFYEHNTPEAVAQAQKGIEAQIKARDGLRQQGLVPPPLDLNTAKAMELITRAPVGSDATPESAGKLNNDLKNLGYKDVNDAMRKIASQNENLKWSKPYDLKGLTPGTTVRVVRDGLPSQEPEQDNAVTDSAISDQRYQPTVVERNRA